MGDQAETPEDHLKFQVLSVERLKPGELTFNFLVTTNLPSYKKPRYTLRREYIELDNLYQYFDKCFPENLPPPHPPKSNDERFLVHATQVFFDRTCGKEVLRRSEGLRSFVESEFAFLPPSPTSKKSSGLFGSLRSQSNVKEVDPFFDTARTDTSSFETGMIGFGRSNDKIAKLERDIGKASSEVSASLMGLTLDAKGSLNGPIKRIAKAFAASEELHNRQSAYLNGAFNDECSMFIKGALGVEGALTYRTELLSDYEQACKTTSKKLQAMEKLKSSSSIQSHKVDAAVQDLTETKQLETDTRDSLKRVTESLRNEYRGYTHDREEDLTKYLTGFVARQVEFGKQHVKIWSISLDAI
ncbi:Vacuolar protein sorting-associated protein 17 [Rhizophlyctis rosea]|nr:Vacuolar protein sorting-associated protein 17 [Rhizophlyctis rosea]